jgi:pimeloyl-ACP methyl ester carboxylesterase
VKFTAGDRRVGASSAPRLVPRMERLGPLWIAVLVLSVCLSPVKAADPAVAARDAGWLAAFRRSREALEWTDLVIRHDWRLQRHAREGRCRILDPAEGTVQAGTEAECRQAFAALEADGTIPSQDGGTVVLLHGLGEGRDSMRPLAEHLRSAIDATVISFGYASVSADIETHSRALAEVVAGLPTRGPVSFVGHSLGNIVVRRWLALADAEDRGQVHRVVMLGPPNQGSQLARMAAGIWGIAGHVDGAARELVFEWQEVAPQLAVPECDFGIVAGGKGDEAGYSPLLAGDDDAVVCVAETRLPGARDFLLLPVHHAAMMRDPKVQRATESFLKTGRFEAAGDAPPVAQ